MKKWLKPLGKDCVRFLIMFIGFSLLVFVYNTWDNSSKAVDTNLWLQSTERQLKNQNEQYYNELYDRYSRIHRDLNDYQYQANKRLETLENRIDNLEESLKQNTISINQTQVNGESNAK